MVTDVTQRKIPLVIQIALLGALIFKSFTPEVNPELYYFFLGSMMSSAIALTLVFYKKKISLHMLGMASLTVFCISCFIHFGIKNVYCISVLLLCNGLVASSRLEMKAHTPTELTLGYLIGLIPQLLLLFFWL
jgi:membrane-associated phospholipid phosphatase